MSWQRYADVHGFTYNLWDRRGIEELPLTPLARRLWHAPPWAKGQHGLLQTSLAKYELMLTLTPSEISANYGASRSSLWYHMCVNTCVQCSPLTNLEDPTWLSESS